MDQQSSLSPRGGIGLAGLLWGVLGLELVQLLLVLLGPASPPWTPGERLPSVLVFVRAVLACLVLPAAGVPAALLILVRKDSRRIGLFALTAVSLGCALVYFFVVALALRLFQPLTASSLSLAALASGAVGILLAGRFEGGTVCLEPGLGRWPLVLGLVLAVGFAAVARVRLFGGPRRMVPVTARLARQLEQSVQPARPVDFLAGVRRVHGARRYVVQGSTTTFVLQGPEPGGSLPARVAFVVTAVPGTMVSLWQVPNEACGVRDRGGRPERELARAVVQEEVLGVQVTGVLPRFNALLVGAAPTRPGPNCFQVRLQQQPRFPVELVDVTGLDLGRHTLLGGWLILASENEIECHLGGLRYHEQLRRSSRVSPNMLLSGCLTHAVGEILAGAQYPLLGVQFLALAYLCLMAALVMLGALGCEIALPYPGAPRRGARNAIDTPPREPPRLRLGGLLLLGPFLLQLHALTYAHVHSFPFPDTAYTALLLGALALLLVRQRWGFVLLGCLAALARYPGAYVLALGLLAHLLFGVDQRRWTRRTLLWSLAAGLSVAGLLLVHWGLSIGIVPVVSDIYFEVFPEHFQVHANPTPLLLRVAIFFVKLLALSGGTIALWPLAWRTRAGRVLIAVTLGYAATLMSVHVPHSHYFPVLTYCAAAAGIGGLVTRRFPAWAGVAIVLAGTAAGLNLQWLLGR